MEVELKVNQSEGKFKPEDVQWGEDNKIGYITYKRTYAREISKGKEEFPDTVERELKGISFYQ